MVRYPTIDELIARVWPRDTARNVNVALDRHEIHFGLNLSHNQILNQIGQDDA